MRKNKRIKVNSGWSVLIVELQKIALNKHLSNMCIQLKLILFSVEKSCLGQSGRLQQFSKM